MNQKLDPVISHKLDDFRIRRRNLTLLRGLCTAILCFFGAFVLIALIDYLSEARMGNELRQVLSIAGYAFVFLMVWKTSIHPLLQLPSAKKLALILEQSSPDLQEDLLSAVELGMTDPSKADSTIFRQLVQQQASTKARKIEIKNILPLGRLKNWLLASAGLVVLTFGLFQIPEFGSDLKLLMKRAMMPGANLPPVTGFEVRILAPDENVTRTPSNEPLRFVALIKPKYEGLRFEEISLETKSMEKKEAVPLSKREQGKFFVDYNVGKQRFEYRVLIDQAPQTEWHTMEVGTRPFVSKYSKKFTFPEYSELQPVEIEESHGDLEAWEGTEVELSMKLSQEVKSGNLAIEWTGKNEELRHLIPDQEKNLLQTKIQLIDPGIYRVKKLIDLRLGWESRPSSYFEISVQPDLAPSVQWIEPGENTLLVAPNDLLSFSALAKDDLGLARVEYMLKKNQGAWKSFPIPKFPDPRRQQKVTFSFQLDLLGHKLRPGTQALLKLRAQDLKGTSAETEIIQLTIVSRDFDLSSIKLLEAKAEIIAKLDTLYDQCSQSQKLIQETQRELQQQKVSKNTWMEKISQVEAGFLTVADPTYHGSLQTLLKMPRGADSHEVSIYAQAKGHIFTSLATHWKNLVDQIDMDSDPNRIRSNSHEFSKIISKRKRISGNLKNIGQDILNQHAEMVAFSYLHSLHQRQLELLEDYGNKKAIPFLARRQEVALNQWEPIAQALSYSKDWDRSSSIKRTDSEQVKMLESLSDGILIVEELEKQIESWQKNIHSILQEAERKLASKTKESFRKKPEELFWNLEPHYTYWDDLKRKWDRLVRARPADSAFLPREVLSAMSTITSETMMRAEVEQARKDQNSLFVKDAGQTGRALIQLQQEVRAAHTGAREDLSTLSEKSEKLGKAFHLLTLQHHLIGSANQVLFFIRQESTNSNSWNGPESARQWGRSEAVWKPALDIMNRLRVAKDAIDRMRKLPNQSYRKILIQEMQARVKSSNHQPKSMIVPAGKVFEELQEIIRLIKPEVLEARSLVNQTAPTLPELARELAQETLAQKKKLEELTEDEELDLTEKREALVSLNELQQEIGDSIENFAQALRQEANIQNLLDQEGRELARDSDTAAALVEQRERAVEENLEQGTQAQNAEELKISGEKTIDEQEKQIQELNLIAEHFENLDDPNTIANSRPELRQMQNTLEVGNEIEEQYEQAERLANLAQLAPDKLLEALEEELEQNEPMKRELSDLAQDTVEEAKEQLEETLAQEKEFSIKIEELDQSIGKEKKDLAEELTELAKKSGALAKEKIDRVHDQANQAKAETTAQKAKESRDQLEAIAQKMEEVSKQQATTQELKDAAIELAESLRQAKDDLDAIALELDTQAGLTPETAQELVEQSEDLAKKRQQEAESLKEKARKQEQLAQEALQESLARQIESEKTKEKASKAKKALERAQDMVRQSPEDPTLQENLKGAEDDFAEEIEAFRKKEKESEIAKQEVEEFKASAEQVKREMENAKEIAHASNQRAEEAQKIADTLLDPEQQEAIAEASERGMKLAREASKEAHEFQEQAAELADALNQLTDEAKGNPELLAQAEETQNQLAEDTFETSQDLARAARHEQRLENQMAGQSLEELAEATESTALDQIPETGQALENQALANQLQELAETAKELSTDLSDQEPSGDEQIAAELSAEAKWTEKLLQENPTFEELQNQAESFSEKANSAETELHEIAKNLSDQAKEAQSFANASKESAQKENIEMKAAMEQARQDAESVKELETSKSSGSEIMKAKEKAEQSIEDAKQAEQRFSMAQKQADIRQDKAEHATKQAKQAEQQASSASDLAADAQDLLDQFPKSPAFSELEMAKLPSAGMALNKVGQALEKQLDALENLTSGTSTSPSKSMENPGANQGDSKTNPFENSSPFSDPEVSEVLAQTLDALDQAIFGAENPFSETASQTRPANQESSGLSGEEMAAPIPPLNSKTSKEAIDQQKQGGSGTTGNGSYSSYSNPLAMEQALQALRMATESHAQSMSQKRSQILRETEGNQFTSGEGEYKVDPDQKVEEIPKLEKEVEAEDWGKLPPKLAKDLMEAKRERVSENYRNQVQAYFEAMSSKARTNK
ncbi:MAG: hypothetical protein VXZ37_01085 [Verrucomicrobiota bacterium]|nr:hypothetical protein [Verrucomicrobiota bacterium]